MTNRVQMQMVNEFVEQLKDPKNVCVVRYDYHVKPTVKQGRGKPLTHSTTYEVVYLNAKGKQEIAIAVRYRKGDYINLLQGGIKGKAAETLMDALRRTVKGWGNYIVPINDDVLLMSDIWTRPSGKTGEELWKCMSWNNNHGLPL